MAKTILVVEDSDTSRLIATRALHGAGYEVLDATNGGAALDLLDGRKIDMAVCDFSMPVMDGIEFVKTLRGIPQYKMMPVMMLTVADEPEILQKGRKAGVNAWMTKPFSFSALVAAVDKLCP